jgi:hypothetical protein
MTTRQSRAYDEYVQFVTSAPTLEQILTFRPSSATEERVRYLLHLNRTGKLSPDERAELAEFSRAEELIHNLKVRARRRLRTGDYTTL